MENPICRRFCGEKGRHLVRWSDGAMVRWLMLYIIPVLLVGAFLYPYIPGHDLPICAIKIATGLDCPGCGMIRSVSALLHGNFLESLRFHPLGIVVVGWMGYVWTKGIMRTKLSMPNWAGKIFVVALFTVWIVRIVV